MDSENRQSLDEFTPRSSRLVAEGAHVAADFERSLTIGRHPDNDLVLDSRRVSTRHAVIEWTRTGFHIRDLGSRNGTSVNGRRIHTWKGIKEGDRIRFGRVSTWRVSRLVEPAPTLGAVACVERRDLGQRIPVDTDRFLIGTSRPADLVVEEWTDGCPSPLRVVLFVESHRLWAEAMHDVPEMTIDGHAWSEDEPLEVRQPCLLELGPTGLWIVPSPLTDGVDTTEHGEGYTKAYGLRLHLTFESAGSGTVRVEHDGGDWSTRAGQRFILLFVLADAAGEWVTDEVLRSRIWGKSVAKSLGRNALNKLIYDTRQMFLAAGLDGWFVEKRRGATRLRLSPERITIVRANGSNA
jgi:hypothetical protein